MLSIRKDLRRLKLAPQQVKRFEHGVTALGDLGDNLTRLVEDHDRWQAIDLELRRIEAVMGHDLGEIKLSWPELRAKVDPLCRSLAQAGPNGFAATAGTWRGRWPARTLPRSASVSSVIAAGLAIASTR